VSALLVIPFGSGTDPKGKEGLADLMSNLCRRGTRGMSADALDDEVELYGGQLHIDAGTDSTTFSVSCPSEQLGRMLRVLARIVSEPLFALKELNLAKKRVLGAIASDMDDPASIAERALLRVIYGDHPYGHVGVGRMESVAAITRADVLGFYERCLGPKGAVLCIVGSLPKDQDIAALAERCFGGWSGGPPQPRYAPPTRAAGSGVWLVDKDDQSQSQVRIATAGIKRVDPRRVPVVLLENVLGGGFTSRLVEEVRVNRGLSYSVRSDWERLRSGGSFTLRSYTQNQTTGALIRVMLDETLKLRDGGMTAQELRNAQQYLSGIYPTRLEQPTALASVIADTKLYQLPEDYLLRYRERLWETSLREVRQVGREVIFKEPPAIIVVGRGREVRNQLRSFGTVRTLSVSELR
jgi:zinc protease